MDNIEQLIGKKVREARIAAKMSQSDLAKNAKTSLTTINRLEKGKQFPHVSTLKEIARVLGLKQQDLFAMEGAIALNEKPGVDVEVLNRLASIESKLESKNGPSIDPEQKELIELIGRLKPRDVVRFTRMVRRRLMGYDGKPQNLRKSK